MMHPQPTVTPTPTFAARPGRRIGNLFVTSEGSGSPVVLLHGWGLDHASWNAVTDQLVPHHRVIGIDMPGHGGSGPATPFTMPELADEVAALLDRLDLAERPVIIGHSMGGMLAQQIVATHPEAARGLIILDADLNASPLIRTALAMAGRLGAWSVRAAAWLLGPERALALVPPVMAPMSYSGAWRRAHGAELSRAARAFAPRTTVDGLAHGLVAVATRPDLTDALRRSTTPALVVRGSGDRVMPRSQVQALAQAIPGARYEELDGSGHMTVIEQPAAVAGRILDWVRLV